MRDELPGTNRRRILAKVTKLQASMPKRTRKTAACEDFMVQVLVRRCFFLRVESFLVRGYVRPCVVDIPDQIVRIFQPDE